MEESVFGNKVHTEPIPAKKTIALMNYIVQRAVDFLNKFYIETQDKIINLERRIERLDTITLLLEEKLNSIPSEIYGSISIPHEAKLAENAQYDFGREAQPIVIAQSQNINQITEPNLQQIINEVIPQIDPEEERKRKEMEELKELYNPYLKLFKVGVPIGALMIKVKNEGLDMEIFEKLIEEKPN